MNTFKINYTITGCCSLFPHSHSVCSVTGCRQRTHRSTVSAVPLQARSVARSAPSHVSVSLAPMVNRRHSLPRRAPVRYRVFRRSMCRDTRNDVSGLSNGSTSSVALAAPAVLPTPSTGARLRRASTILPFRAWHCVPVS